MWLDAHHKHSQEWSMCPFFQEQRVYLSQDFHQARETQTYSPEYLLCCRPESCPKAPQAFSIKGTEALPIKLLEKLTREDMTRDLFPTGQGTNNQSCSSSSGTSISHSEYISWSWCRLCLRRIGVVSIDSASTSPFSSMVSSSENSSDTSFLARFALLRRFLKASTGKF